MEKRVAEDELGSKLDRCFADSLLKVGGGLAIGILTSITFFKGRLFPVWFGTGIGLGMGWSNCRHDLNSPFLLHGKKVRVDADTKEKPTYQIIVQSESIKN